MRYSTASTSIMCWSCYSALCWKRRSF